VIKPELCPNPECRKTCKVNYISGSFEWDPQSYHQVECQGSNFTDRCGYKGPKVIKAEDAVRLHNLICHAAAKPEVMEGWKLVPVALTQEMRRAAVGKYHPDLKADGTYSTPIEQVWSALLSAVPGGGG
jgi:hypothetical protein